VRVAGTVSGIPIPASCSLVDLIASYQEPAVRSVGLHTGPHSKLDVRLEVRR
jgi:hypothetical protein